MQWQQPRMEERPCPLYSQQRMRHRHRHLISPICITPACRTVLSTTDMIPMRVDIATVAGHLITSVDVRLVDRHLT
jgi:hypothetical protein